MESITELEIQTHLNIVYDLIHKGEIDDAIDVVFDQFDDLLCAGRFSDCALIIRQVDLEQLDSNLCVAFISICSMARDKLPYLKEFGSKARLRLTQIPGVDVDGCMKGFNL